MNRFEPPAEVNVLEADLAVGAETKQAGFPQLPVASPPQSLLNPIVRVAVEAPEQPVVDTAAPAARQTVRSTVWLAVAGVIGWMLLLVGGLLVKLAVARVERAIGAVFQRDEVMYGEGIIFDHAARILHGAALYQPLGQAPYSIAAYTPVYYWIVAALQWVFGPSFGPGRVVSIAAGLVAAACVGYLAAGPRRRVWAGLFAAAMFLALGFPGAGDGFDYPWFGFYKEDMLAVTLSIGAIVALSGGASRRRVVVAAILAALAVLTKQTLGAAGVAGFVWLLLRDRRLALLFAGICGGLVVSASLVMELTTHAYFANTFAISGRTDPFNDYVLQQNLAVLLQFQAAPLGITAAYLIARLRRWRTFLDDPMVLYALASLVPLVGLAKIGSNYNYWIDLAAITAVFVTRMIWDAVDLARHQLGGGGIWRWAAAAAPIVVLGVLGGHLAIFLRDVRPATNLELIIPSEQARDLRHPDAYQWVVERVRTEPKQVLSESADVVALAGRPMLVETIIFSIMVNNEQWDDGPVVQRICAGDVGLLVLKGPLQGGTVGEQYLRSALWPPRVLEALRETMHFETMKAGMLIYSPGGNGQPVEASGPANPTPTTRACTSRFG